MISNDLQWLPMTTNDYQLLPMTTDDYPMTIPWLSDDYPMTIQWLIDDCPMTIWWLSDDYLMTIQRLSIDYPMTITNFWYIFLMIIDLKRSIDRRWLFKSGATFILRWSFSVGSFVWYLHLCLMTCPNDAFYSNDPLTLNKFTSHSF